MSLDQLTPGMYVLYVPPQAGGNLTHPAVEKGVITSVNASYAFVRFGGDSHSKACLPGDLR